MRLVLRVLWTSLLLTSRFTTKGLRKVDLFPKGLRAKLLATFVLTLHFNKELQYVRPRCNCRTLARTDLFDSVPGMVFISLTPTG